MKRQQNENEKRKIEQSKQNEQKRGDSTTQKMKSKAGQTCERGRITKKHTKNENAKLHSK